MAYFSLFALGLSDNVRGPLYPEILKTFEVSDTRGAAFYAMASLLGFCGSFLVRFLLRHLSRVKTLQFSMGLMTVSLAGMGGATQFSWLLFFSAAYGFSLGLVGVIQNVLVTLGSRPDRRQRMLSGLHATYGVASLLAPLTVALVNFWGGTWRTSFYAASLVAGVVFFGSLPAKERVFEPQGSAEFPSKSPHWQTHAGQLYIALAVSFYTAVEILISSRLALYLRRDFHFDLQTSTYYVTAFFISLLSGRLVFAFFHFKMSVRNTLSVSLLSSLALMILGLSVSPVFLVILGLTMAPFYPLAMSYISEHFDTSLDSAISTTLALAYLMTVLMHGLVGYLTDLYGISKALWVGPGALILAFMVISSFETFFRKKI
jgi:fucose permease